jgi:hypothetical protein
MSDADPAPTRTAESQDSLAERLRRIPPPPMQVVYKGWFRDIVTYRSAAELEREEREREARAR